MSALCVFAVVYDECSLETEWKREEVREKEIDI